VFKSLQHDHHVSSKYDIGYDGSCVYMCKDINTEHSQNVKLVDQKSFAGGVTKFQSISSCRQREMSMARANSL